MADATRAELHAEIRSAIADRQKRDLLLNCMKRGRDTRSEALATLEGGSAFRAEVKRVKTRCIACQEELLARFSTNAEKRGAKVFLAADAQAAIGYVLDLAKARGVKTIAKSKSLTTEEIEINEPLIAEGIRVVETDLGELIIQLVDEKPYHLVFPSVHKTAEDVAKIFAKETGEEVSSDIDSIMKVVRKYLRPIFLNTDIGMTGANVGIAETGGIVIETNEGNGRLVSSIGECHVCIMGMEKIVETIEEAMLMVLAHPISASGQLPTTYVTWMHGRSPLGEGAQTPRESHIIILDNGRTKMRDDPAMREALHCIRCGACMNVCPTYGVVGGHSFGYIYPGPIGIPWTAQVHGMDKASRFAPLCISCGLCKEICPADIDMPMMIAEVKHRDHQVNPASRADATMMAAERYAALGSATAPFSNWVLRMPLFRRFLATVAGVEQSRVLPEFARPSLVRRFRRRASRPAGNAKRKVVFFADVYANYNAPEMGMAAICHLESIGCEVAMPPQRSSGYPFIAYGDLDRARDTAQYNVESLAKWVAQGYDIVSPEPTAVYALRHCYPKLLNDMKAAQDVASRTYELFEYFLMAESTKSDASLKGRRFGFHCSCHQRPLGAGNHAIEWLEARGAQVERIETGTCCGMGGTFGLKAGALGFELSQAVGEALFEAFKESEVEAIITESSVCQIHLRQGTGLPVYHPLEFLGKAGTVS